jgi:hypothetical protein
MSGELILYQTEMDSGATTRKFRIVRREGPREASR